MISMENVTKQFNLGFAIDRKNKLFFDCSFGDKHKGFFKKVGGGPSDQINGSIYEVSE